MRKFVTKVIALLLSIIFVLTVGCAKTKNKVSENLVIYKNNKYSTAERVKDLVNRMSLEEEIGQMVQADRANITPKESGDYKLGSILSGGGSTPEENSPRAWTEMISKYQENAVSTRLGIPIIYGVDAVHGNNIVKDAVVFPHNIGLGAANDTELMKNIASVTAEEMISTGITYDFSPCVAVVKDLRWGRYYEGYSENVDIVNNLSSTFIRQLQTYGVAATAKHFIGDGAVLWGTGDHGYKIDEGNVITSEDKLLQEEMRPYEEAVKAGVKSIMISFSSINGVKNHSNEHLIKEVLKGKLGFQGFVISDWEGIHQIPAASFEEQVIIAINAGIDMLMEPIKWKETIVALKNAVDSGKISKERVDDAVARILTVKFDLGLFENNLGNKKLVKNSFGSKEHREVAKAAVRESMVLLKNDGVLPIKKNAKVFVTGPASDSIGIQCGGWTIDWQGNQRQTSGTTILEGLKSIADKNGGKVITDINEADDADVSVVVLGEKSYAEGKGDDGSLGLEDGMALDGNYEALKNAEKLNKPIITILVSGRPRIVTDDLKNWSAFVEAWLPGTQGDGVADVIYGDYNFKGKLPVSWPKTNSNLPIKADNILFPYGYGLKY